MRILCLFALLLIAGCGGSGGYQPAYVISQQAGVDEADSPAFEPTQEPQP